MNLLLSSNTLSLVLSLFGLALVFGVPLLFYGYMADRVWFEGQGRVQSQGFGSLDAAAAGGLILLFALLVVSGFSSAAQQAAANSNPSNQAMILGVVASTLLLLLIIAGIIGSLMLRNIAWRDMLGLRSIGLGSVVARAGFLLLLAMPLVYGSLALTRILLAGSGYDDDSQQELVRFLAGTHSGAARGIIAVSAVCIAPIQEEFIFRGFLYGVIRRYAGPVVGVVINAALFAGIHLHAPSLGGLFVLAVCLTLAYEWTGCLLVPMVMHALFNSLSIVSLLSGNPGK